MNKFGFALTPSSRIDLDKFNKEKFASLVKLEPDVLKCMACGSCTASCTAGKFTRTSVRSVMHLLNHKRIMLLQLVNMEKKEKCVLLSANLNFLQI